jgi:hypothetical protein
VGAALECLKNQQELFGEHKHVSLKIGAPVLAGSPAVAVSNHERLSNKTEVLAHFGEASPAIFTIDQGD